MARTTKTAQSQIRLNAEEKRAVAQAAQDTHQGRFADVVRRLANKRNRSYVFAELDDLLVPLSAGGLRRAVATPPPASLPPVVANYLAATIEYACAARGIHAPAWTQDIAPLTTPFFGSKLISLRLHLLANSPPPFRRRNIFIDTSIGGRV